MDGVWEAACGFHHRCMTWHGRPWDGMAHTSEVRERGATIEGLKQGVEPYLARMVKIVVGKRGGERPAGPSF